MQETQESRLQSPGWEDSLERKWQLTPVFLPWKILWTEEPNGLQSTGLQRVRHHWATKHACSHAKARIIWGLEERYFITDLFFTCLAYLGWFVETSDWVDVREVFGLYHNIYIWINVYSYNAFLLPLLFFDYWTFLKYNM